MGKIHKYRYLRYLFIIIFLLSSNIRSQNQDSLLEKIKNLDISLEDDELTYEENLYLQNVSFQNFYDLLFPYGEWIQVTKDDIEEDLNEGEGQGRNFNSIQEEEFLFIWKPNENTDWKPYLNGRWIYTEQGWFWESSDKWGNYTYNYGRWWNSKKFGWVWLPGYVWAPSWVRWKISEDHKYIGWVGLTPKAKWEYIVGINENNYRYKNKNNEWVFTDINNFSDEINHNATIKSNKINDILTSCKDIINVTVINDRINSLGPDVNKIESISGKKMKRKQLRFHKNNRKIEIGENDIVVGKSKLSRYDNKEVIDKPKKFKRSEKVKKMIKKRIKEKIKHRGRK